MRTDDGTQPIPGAAGSIYAYATAQGTRYYFKYRDPDGNELGFGGAPLDTGS